MLSPTLYRLKKETLEELLIVFHRIFPLNQGSFLTRKKLPGEYSPELIFHTVRLFDHILQWMGPGYDGRPCNRDGLHC